MNVETLVLKDVSERLDRAHVPYMLTGSMALNFLAQPRFTRDIDVVVDLEVADARSMVALFSPDYILEEETVRDAISRRSIFNAIQKKELVKVDFIVRKKGLFHHHEFARRNRVSLCGFETWVTTKEDLIVAKLNWAKTSLSETQLRDVKNLIVTGCDLAYVTDWVAKLGLETVFDKARQ